MMDKDFGFYGPVNIGNDTELSMNDLALMIIKLTKGIVATTTAFANEIDTLGKAIVGTYNYEIAETKALEITGLARSNNFPLKVSLEQISG